MKFSKSEIKEYYLSKQFQDKVFSHPECLTLAKKFVRKCKKRTNYKIRLAYELNMIQKKGFIKHFLLARDILDLTKDIPHITRGSCGSSLVCYLMGISNIDPVKEEISFSRFLNKYRKVPPDIDFDFPHNKREIVFKRVYDKYNDKVCRISNHIYYKDKSALRQAIKDCGVKGRINKKENNANLYPEKKKDIVKRKNELQGEFRHYSLHCGGIIFYEKGVPKDIILKKEDNEITQIKYNKDDVEDNEKLKIDILSNRGISLLYDIDKRPLWEYPTYDEKTINLLKKGDNLGIVFAESPIMRKTIKALQPKSVKDLATCLALIRPAAASGGKKTKYLQNAINGSHIECIIFDDDAISHIKKLIDCDEGEADRYRRSFAKRKYNDMNVFGYLIKDMDDNDSIMDDLEGLHKYSFCKSHAYSYAQLCWALAYSKAHNPKKFWKSALNNCHSMYRTWVHFWEANKSGLELTLGVKPWKIKNNKLIGCGKDLIKNKIKDTKDINDSIVQYKNYGYWTKPQFLSNLYLKKISKHKNNDIVVEFRGLIATGRKYYNKNFKKRGDGCTFITIGYGTGKYIDITITGLHSLNSDIVSGIGILKKYIDKCTYYSIDVTQHKFEWL
ncbi:MAG: hypothetical protein CMF62_03580 [Magnetococcales bacterium]|nr:hypothetical protein [Magnetococcales bacterium]|tara:strand:- start:36803 stop:38647 length:1845 start_codon:yes stop_codon:yes gene_type:complete